MTSNIVSGARYRKVADVELLRPIQDEQQYESVLNVVRELVLKPAPTPEELEYLEALSLFVESYEEDLFSLEGKPSTPLELLQTLVDEHSMSGSDLGRLLGNRSLGGAILRGERKLSKSHIKILSGYFRVSAELFRGGSNQGNS